MVMFLAATRHFAIGVWAAEEIEAKQVGREPNLRPDLRRVPVGTQRKTGTKWDSSATVAADFVLPPTLLALTAHGRPLHCARLDATGNAGRLAAQLQADILRLRPARLVMPAPGAARRARAPAGCAQQCQAPRGAWHGALDRMQDRARSLAARRSALQFRLATVQWRHASAELGRRPAGLPACRPSTRSLHDERS